MGFINVQKCMKEPQQLVKLIVLVVCVCFTIYQLSECIKKLLHPPVSTYYKFNLNDTMKYPSLTFCRKPAYKKDLFPKYGLKTTVEPYNSKAFVNFKFKLYTLDQFVEETTYSFKEMLLTYGYSGSGLDPSVINVKSSFHLQYGRCITLTPTIESSTFSTGGGYFLYFLHNIMKKDRDDYGVSNSGFQIFLHDENEILSSEMEQQNNFLDNLYLETAEDMRVKLTVQKYNQVPTADEPCVTDLTYSKSRCQEECLHYQLAQKVSCSTSWQRLPPNVTFPTCSNYEDLNYLLSGILITMNRTRLLKNCDCPISCNISIYTTYIINKREIFAEHQPNSIMMIYYANNIIEVMSKVITYDWNVFLSDIGGSLGFLLGLSVIGVIAALEEICKILIKRFFKAKKKKEVKAEEDNGKVSNKDVNVEDKESDKNNYRNIMDYLAESDYFEKNTTNKDRDEINKY